MDGIGKLGAGVAALVTGALAGCATPGAPASPDPVRFLLAGEPGPCRVAFGPLTPDALLQLQEVGQIDAPSGATYLRRGIVADDTATGPDLEIGGIDVRIATLGGEVSVSWRLPPTTIGFSTPSLDEEAVRAALPELVGTADIASLARAVAELIDGADVTFAGRAPEYDVGSTSDDGLVVLAGRGVEHERLDAYFGLLGSERDGDGWRTDALGGTTSRAAGATITMTTSRSPEAVEPDAFVALLEELLGEGAPEVTISDGALAATPPSCDATAPGVPVDATITDVAIAESDVGDVLRITFDGLPADGPDPELLHIAVGAVELVARYQGGPTVDFPATLTHDESRLLGDRLSP